MPKLKKYPKQPKASSSIAVWERWERRCAEVAKYNAELKKAPEKKRALKAKVEKLKMK